MKKITLLAAFVAIVFTLVGPATVLAGTHRSEPKSPEAIASIYVVDLVATAAFGVAMNDAGDVTGTSYPDPGCGSTCRPPRNRRVEGWTKNRPAQRPGAQRRHYFRHQQPGLDLRVRWVLWFRSRGGMEAER